MLITEDVRLEDVVLADRWKLRFVTHDQYRDLRIGIVFLEKKTIYEELTKKDTRHTYCILTK